MSVKTLSWIVLGATILGAVLLFNHWASYQLLSTLAYARIVAALLGLANLAYPFRFLGVRKRAVGALILGGGVALTVVALFWPAATIRVAQPRTRLDEVMSEYQFFERHSARIHARPEQVMEAVRQSTFGDMRSLVTLLKIRGAALRIHDTGAFLQDKRILDAFAESGYLSGGSEHEIVMCGAVNARVMRRPDVRALQELGSSEETRTVYEVVGVVNGLLGDTTPQRSGSGVKGGPTVWVGPFIADP